MKKFLFIALAMVAGFGSFAQQKAEEVMKVDQEKYNFGKVKQGVPVTTVFTVTNTSDKPIMIERAWASCGCTTPEYTSEPFGANGTTKVKVGYNAANIGEFTKDVFIKLAGINEPKVIKITGEVVDAASYQEVAKAEPVKKAEPAKTAKKVTKAKKATAGSK